MKYIGIKLADGSFYPILQKGVQDKKNLDLTTVKDNQTTVQVDLYSSDTGTMEGAEYVDTLEIRQLEPHPNGEPNLELEVSLDDEDRLHAQVVDPETGKSSQTQVVISKALSERNQSETKFDTDSTDSFEQDIKDINSYADEPAPAVNDTFEQDLKELNSFSFGEGDDGSTTLNVDELAQLGQNTKLSVEKDANSADNQSEENMIGPSVNDETFTFEDSQVSALGTDDVNETTDSITEAISKTEDQLEDTMQSISSTLNDFSSDTDFDLPDFSDLDSTGESLTTNTTETDDFDLPDFGEVDLNTEEEAVSKAAASDDDFTIPDFGEEESSSSYEETEASYTPAGALDFNGLYDKETLEGSSSASDEQVAETVKKKTKVPVIICIVCAIICIIAALLVLFVIPSRINLLSRDSRKKQTQQAQEQIESNLAQLPAPVEQDEPVIEPEPEPVVETITPKEDVIVIAPNPETVVPEKPAPAAQKAEDIRYKIKWGDTLWDIADAYYKNPWKYKNIARYNNIKNPDYIISGTWILIPAE